MVTLLQGGWITTAVKHKQQRCFFNSCPFYITTNKIPDFGAEEEHVLRRLAIYQTQSLQEIIVGAEKWIFDNAMACVSWMATEISANLEYTTVFHKAGCSSNESLNERSAAIEQPSECGRHDIST